MRNLNEKSGFKKEALNLKSFKSYWPIALRQLIKPYYVNKDEDIPKYKDMDIKEAYSLYQRGLLSEQLQANIETFDQKTSLHLDPGNFSYPKSELRARQEEARRIMLSGRHSPDAFFPTSDLGLDLSEDPIQALGDPENQIYTADPSTGKLILTEGGEWSKPGGLWAPFILVYKGTSSVIAKQYENPNEARWVSSHPDVSSGYAKKGREGYLEIYDLRLIPKEDRSIYSKHVHTDTRGMDPDTVRKRRLGGATGWRESPYYEMVVSDAALHKARIAKYKSLPGLGWMLVEGRNVLREGLTPEEAEESKNLLIGEAESLAKEHPSMFFYYNFHKLKNKNNLTLKALNSLAKKNPKDFEGIYSLLDQETAEEYREEIDGLLKDIVVIKLKKDPGAFSPTYYESLLDGKKISRKQLEDIIIYFAKEEPFNYFLHSLYITAENIGLKELNIPALKQLASLDPSIFLFNERLDRERARMYEYFTELGLDVNKVYSEAITKLAESDPKKYFALNGHLNNPPSVSLDAYKILSKKDPFSYLFFKSKNEEIPSGPLDLIAIDEEIKPSLKEVLLNILKNNFKNFFKELPMLLETPLDIAISFKFYDIIEDAFKIAQGKLFGKNPIKYFTDKSMLSVTFYEFANIHSLDYINEMMIEKTIDILNKLAIDDIEFFLDLHNFITNYKINPVISKVIYPRYIEAAKEGLKNLFNRDPELFTRGMLDYDRNSKNNYSECFISAAIDFGMTELSKDAFRYAKNLNLKNFLLYMLPGVESLGFTDLIEEALMEYANQDPLDYLIQYIFRSASKSGFDYINKIAYDKVTALGIDIKNNLPSGVYTELINSISNAAAIPNTGLTPDSNINLEKTSNLIPKLIKLSNSLVSLGYQNEAVKINHIIKSVYK